MCFKRYALSGLFRVIGAVSRALRISIAECGVLVRGKPKTGMLVLGMEALGALVITLVVIPVNAVESGFVITRF